MKKWNGTIRERLKERPILRKFRSNRAAKRNNFLEEARSILEKANVEATPNLMHMIANASDCNHDCCVDEPPSHDTERDFLAGNKAMISSYGEVMIPKFIDEVNWIEIAKIIGKELVMALLKAWVKSHFGV